MEKIKSVLSGHKKSEDAAHDAPTSSGGTHQEGQTHPIYDEMKGPSSVQPATAGTTLSAGQTGASTGLSHTEQKGTEGSLAGHSVRPGAPGAGNMHDGISQASIKSGVIGFGTSERQEHAALSSHQNPEANLDRNQVVGGGNMAPGPTNAQTSEQPGVLPLSGTAGSDQSHSGIGNTGMLGNTTQSSRERQPYEHTLRQESYTNDTDRSFPLAGGVAPKHDSSVRHDTELQPTGHHTTSTLPVTQQSASSPHPLSDAREPGTKEKEAGVTDGSGREALAGAAAAAAAVGVAAPLSQSHERPLHGQGLETRDATHGSQPLNTSSTIPASSTTGHTTQSHNPEALAAATAAAAKSSTMPPPTQGVGASAANTQSHDSRYNDPGRPPGGRSISYRHVPGGFPTPTPDDSKTFLFYRDEVVPKPGLDGPVKHHVPSTRGTPYGQHQLESRAPPVTAGTTSGLAGGLADSHAPAASDTTAVPAGQHELRHTGSLEQPTPHSAEYIEEHHHGRDAAIAGGVGAGAAGLGYAATHKRDTPEAANAHAPVESNPYSAKQLDPRALGSKAKLEEQRYDPQAQSAATTSHTSTGPHKSSLLNKLDPRVKNDNSSTTDSQNTPAKEKDPQNHHARDAALVGGGAATAAGVHHSLQRNDTPGTGTAVLPAEQSSRGTGPLSSTTTAPEHSAGTSAPLSSSKEFSDYSSHPAATKKYEPYQGPSTTSGSPFYGTAGAPAPVESSSGTHQPMSTSAATVPVSQHQDPQHHYGRDAALVGAGAGTAGGLAYASQHDNRTDTGPASNTLGPHSSNAANVLDPRVQPDPSKQIHHNVGPTAEDPASRTVGPHSSNVANIVDPRVQPDPSKQKAHTTTGPHQSDTLNRLDPQVDEKAGHQGQHHLGRDAALVGGTGAAGYGAYEAINAYGDHRSTQPGASMNEQRYDPSASAHPPSGTIAPQNTRSTGVSHAPHDSVLDAQGQDHSKRDAALLGTAGAATAGGAAYAYDQHSDSKHERAQLEKEQHAREKDQHKLDKEQEKNAHRLEKEREKEAHRLEKEREKETSTPEKKHGILGFLHRDKSKKEKSSADTSPRHSGEVRRSTDNKRHSKEYAAGGAALGAGTTAAAYDDNHPDSPRWKGKNRLHKDPPAGHPARESLEHHEMGEMPTGKREHFGTDGAIGDANAISGQHETRHNTYGAVPVSEALGHDNNKVVEPHTGLPMNVGRFGDGHGGTDANPTVHGMHDHAAGAGTGTTTDWEAIKKADTPY